MQDLPLPQLTHTLRQYAEAVAPLLSCAEQQRDAAAIEEFLAGPGPVLQRELEGLAARESPHGRSWLTRAWLEMYLRTREPLQLVSSVAFQITWPRGLSGTARAADLIHRIAAVHLQHLRGELSASIGGRGEELTPAQWRHLPGGVRRPRESLDLLDPGPVGAAGRTVIVLHRGHGYRLRVSGPDGRPLAPETIRAGLDHILAAAPAREGTFADLTPTPGEVGAHVLAARLATDAGRGAYAALRESLFAIDLDESARTDRAHLRDLAFSPAGVLAHKTTSYRVDLTGDFVGVSLEHSITDGATLIELLARAKELDPVAAAPQGNPAAEPTPVPLTWGTGARAEADLAAAREEFGRRAESFDVGIAVVPGLPDGIVSHDGAMQWILLYASLRTWGRVRSTYEAVDMRHYAAGRTESFRPHTAAAVEFVSALIHGSADVEQLRAAARAHSGLVRAAKTGQGLERHLFALREMARESGTGEAFFAGVGYEALTENFLSTTSLGSPDHLTRCAFAPPAPGGLGVNYTRVEGGYEFCVSYDTAADPGAAAFLTHLREGAEALIRVAGRSRV